MKMKLKSDPNEKDSGVKVYTAWHIWNIAADAAKRATDVKKEFPRACTADTVSAVIISAASTEAFINEFADRLSNIDRDGRWHVSTNPIDWKGTGEILEALEDAHSQVTAKYLMASNLLPNEALRKGNPPFQDFETLVKMRNHFVHPAVKQTPPDYYKDFRAKAMTYNTPSDKLQLAGWRMQLETPEVARWACRAAHNIIWNIVRRLGDVNESVIEQLYKDLSFQWKETINDKRVKEI